MYPVSRIAPRTLVCGTRYKIVLANSTMPSGRSRLLFQPDLLNPSTTCGGATNFMTALNMSISDGKMVSTQPVQYIQAGGFGFGVVVDMTGTNGRGSKSRRSK